jgi:hypothetical protein
MLEIEMDSVSSFPREEECHPQTNLRSREVRENPLSSSFTAYLLSITIPTLLLSWVPIQFGFSVVNPKTFTSLPKLPLDIEGCLAFFPSWGCPNKCIEMKNESPLGSHKNAFHLFPS